MTFPGRAGREDAAPPINDADRLREIAARRFDDSISATEIFFESNVDAVSAAARDMARSFNAGGRLLAFGSGPDASDAQHVSVEFLHPVIVGKRALPAIALTNDVGTVTATTVSAFAPALATLGRSGDIALAIGATRSAAVDLALSAAMSMGMLTISIESVAAGAESTAAHHRFVVGGADSLIAQEVAETLYHVLWELVHLFLEHGTAENSCSLCGDVAMPMTVVSVDAGEMTAEAVGGGGAARIALDLVDGVAPGDSVLVHQGFAIQRSEPVA